MSKKKGEEATEEKNRRKKRVNVSEGEIEEIFNLREQGNSYRQISIYFKNRNRNIESSKVKEYCKIIYQQKGIEEPQNGRRDKITDGEIYNLRKKGYSYNAISKYYLDMGIKVSASIIQRRCKEIFEAKGEEEPRSVYCLVNVNGEKIIQYEIENEFRGMKKKETPSDISDEEIFELRESGMMFNDMINYFAESGRKIQRDALSRRCKEIYKVKGVKYPKLIRKKKSQIGEEDVIDEIGEKIYLLKKQGMSNREIAESLNNNNIRISEDTVRRKCNAIYLKKGEEIPNVKDFKKEKIDEKVIEEIYKFRQQGLTVQEIFEHIKRKNIEISYGEIGKICRKKFGVGFKWKEGNDTLVQKIYELRKKGMTYKQIEECLKSNSIDVKYSKIRNVCKKIFLKKGENEPKIKRVTKKDNNLTDEIYRLKKEGKSYIEIAERCRELGYDYSAERARYLCLAIFEERGEEVPKSSNKNISRAMNIPEEIKEKIFQLRKKGVTFEAITKFINEECNFKISASKVRKLCVEGNEDLESLEELKARLERSLERKAKSEKLLGQFNSISRGEEKISDENTYGENNIIEDEGEKNH